MITTCDIYELSIVYLVIYSKYSLKLYIDKINYFLYILLLFLIKSYKPLVF